MEEHDFIFVLEPEILKKAGLEPEILKKAGIEKDGRSWIAAKIQVRHSVAVQ